MSYIFFALLGLMPAHAAVVDRPASAPVPVESVPALPMLAASPVIIEGVPAIASFEIPSQVETAPSPTAGISGVPQAQSSAQFSATPQLQAAADPDRPIEALFDGGPLRRAIFGNPIARALAPRLVGERLKAALIVRMDAEPALAAHAAYFHSEQTSLRVVSPRELRSKTAIAEYSDDKNVVSLNRKMMGAWLCLLAARGLSLDRAAEVLAQKLLPTLAHELRHGITKDEWREALGLRSAPESRENETLSFADELKVWQALPQTASLPALDEHHAIFSAFWKEKGWAGIEEIVDLVYGAPSLRARADREKFDRVYELQQAAVSPASFLPNVQARPRK